MNTKKIEINGFVIDYEEGGAANDITLVFAHGLGGNVDQWIDQIEYFSSKYHVISFSLQGHGQSSRSDNQSDYKIQAYARTATDLLKKLQVDNCIWIGNSMGGVIGYEIIRQGSINITKLITNGTTPELVFSSGALRMVHLMDQLLIRIMGFSRYVRLASNSVTKLKNIREKAFQMMIQTHPFAIIESHQLLGSYSYLDILDQGKVPVVSIITRYDKDITRSIEKAMGKLTNRENLKLIKLDNYGHIYNMENPSDYNKRLETILNE